jgi:hypothetical protein
MPGHSTPFPPGTPGTASPRLVRGLVAVTWRHAGLIAACVLVGSAASLVGALRQPPARVVAAKATVPADDRETSDVDPLDHGIEAEIVRARADLRRSEDRIVTLLATDGNAFEGALRLDLSPDATGNASTTTAAASDARASELPLRLDEARPPGADDGATVRAPPARTVREHTPLEAELNRLERVRQLARGRWVALQDRFDRIDLSLHLPPAAAGRRPAFGEAPQPAWADAWIRLGPVAGLLLGLSLAARRELGGDRMRSPREAERALGLPVLGAIPTLSARARNACLRPAEPA